MEELNVVYRLQKYLKEVIQDHQDTIMSGIDTMDKYKYLVGKVQAFEQVQQELSNLLETKEHNNE
jgi:hypothetical protein